MSDQQILTTPAKLHTITDLETIKVMADERRLAILRLLSIPQSVKEISSALDTPQSQLYYHVNLLEKHGLIQVVETQVVSGIIEKRYQKSAEQFHLRNPMLMGDAITTEETTALFSSVFDETKEDLRAAFKYAPPRVADEPPLHPFVSRKPIRLTQEQLVTFHAKLDALIKECDTSMATNQVDEATTYSLLVAFFQYHDDNDISDDEIRSNHFTTKESKGESTE